MEELNCFSLIVFFVSWSWEEKSAEKRFKHLPQSSTWKRDPTAPRLLSWGLNKYWTSPGHLDGIQKKWWFLSPRFACLFFGKKKNSLVNMKSDGIKRSTTDYPSEWCEQPNVVPALWLCCRLVEGSSTGHLFTADSTNLTSTTCQKSAQDVLFAHILN